MTRKLSSLFGKTHERKKADVSVQCDIMTETIQATLLLLDKMPKFNDSKAQNFPTFLNVLQQKMKLFKLNEKCQMNLLMNCITGEAEKRMLKHLNVQVNNWNELVCELNKIFATPLDSLTTIHSLRGRKQGPTESPTAFAEAIKAMVHELFTLANGYDDALQEKEMIRYFVRGAQQPIKKQLKGNRFTSLEQALILANAIATRSQGDDPSRKAAKSQ